MTKSTTLEAASSSHCELGESPLWHSTLAVLFWVDIAAKRLYRLDPSTSQESCWDLPEEPGSIGLVAGGESGAIASDRLVVALRSGFHFIRWPTPERSTIEVNRITPTLFDTTRFRFNDGKVDPQGRFWAGTLFEPKTSACAGLYCLERGLARAVTGPDRAESPWQDWGVTTSNGLAYSPDGRRLYHSDTPAHVVYVHDVDPQSGMPLNRRVWWRIDGDKSAVDYGGRPDGAAVDTDGCYWTALYEGGRIVKLSPDGELLRAIAVPARCPTMVTFGGADLRTLYITTARQGRSPSDLARWPQSGRVFALRVAVAGLPQHGYRG